MATLIACQSTTSSDIANTEESVAAASKAATEPNRSTLRSSTQSTNQSTGRIQDQNQEISPAPGATDLWDRIRSGLTLQEFYFHADVTEQMEDLVDNQAYFDLTIERARPFLFTIVNEIERRGLPLELALLPFVESGFNPNADSSENAIGIWQFMPATAASLGLQRDWWYDGRRDPRDSTIAALDYLEELYQLFDQDWLLALAAYNVGDGNVKRVLRRSNVDSTASPFWDLRLPRETRLHVPRVLALARIVNDPSLYGVTLAPIDNTDALAEVQVGAQIDFAQAAQLAGMNYEDLRALNPGYLQWATHPDQPQHILLPPAQALLLESALSQLSPAQLLTWDNYLIESGDTLADIARRFQTRVDVLQRVNGLRGSQIIAGRSLMIPRNPDALGDSTAPYVANTPPPISIPGTYRIRPGDTLWGIARRFDLRSADIALWNSINPESVLRPGQVINLIATGRSAESSVESEPATASTYIVRQGDSLSSIAARFNTSLDALLKQNNLEAAALIFPGQVIEVSQ